MVRKDINKNLIKSIGKYPIVSDIELERVGKVVTKEALRKKNTKSKPKKGGKKKKDCGCGD